MSISAPPSTSLIVPRMAGQLFSEQPYTYTPLNTTPNTIRLLIIEPLQQQQNRSSNLDDLQITTRLNSISFAQRPKYSALSYTWGSSEPQEYILIDGRPFLVGDNLFHALLSLRHKTEERVFWIDAICINQDDVKERNAQLALMPWIYTRAKTVLVWLTNSLSSDIEGKFKNNDYLWESFWNGRDVSRDMASGMQTRLLRDICGLPYWQRVWIVQEISLARKILVCVGERVVEWKMFIEKIKTDEKEGDIVTSTAALPIQLQRQIDDKYGDGHLLQNLVTNHREKLCKEPRDHIYGFLGLSRDGHRFPMDYEKSLYEVWKDAVIFKSISLGKDDRDVIGFGNMVRDLLGGKRGRDIARTEELGRDEISKAPDRNIRLLEVIVEGNSSLGKKPELFDECDPPRIHSSYRPRIMEIPTFVGGEIVHTGPDIEEIMGDYEEAVRWRVSIEASRAGENSDLFLEMLEEFEEEELSGVVSSLKRNISWFPSQKPRTLDKHTSANGVGVRGEGGGGEVSKNNETSSESLPVSAGWESTSVLDERGTSSSSTTMTTSGRRLPKLCLINTLSSYSNCSSGSIGLVPQEAEVGDFLHWVHGTKKNCYSKADEQW
ncbi:hypothetical protein G7Y89_g6842 [Cudoniella acicularis]|uniref:Heterokaryon incompatibility domain-containing protein n=1 Tax=Cudoniella acicularis TaxID=354080 RepID=A0A8H4W544_9HELO|nr:hypothetical protein G7Y89_g6842 [Cudoniella acicularis]